MPDTSPPSPRLTFRPRHRLRHALEFKAVYDAGARKIRGPISVIGLPNGLAQSRLGLSVGRRVGTAAARNTVKRRLREAFRHMQHDFPVGYDVIVAVRPHEPLTLAEYQRLLFAAWRSLHAEWSRRSDA